MAVRMSPTRQAVLCLVVCARLAAGELPFLFPTEQDTQGLVYNDVTGHLLPVEAIFKDCLCLGEDDPPQEVPLDALVGTPSPCGVFVLYTSRSSASFMLLNLDFDGVILRQREDAEYEITEFGEEESKSTIDVSIRKLSVNRRGKEDEFADGVNYLLENLPLETSVQFKVTTAKGLVRMFYIYRKRRRFQRTAIDIQLDENNSYSSIQRFNVTFSDLFTPKRTPEQIEELARCEEQHGQKFLMRPSDQAILFNPDIWEVECPTVFPEDFTQESLEEVINVEGADNYTVTFAMLPFDPTTLFRSAILLNVTSVSNNITISVNSGALDSFGTADFEGHVQQTFVLGNDSYYSQDELQAVESVGTVMGVMAAVAVSTAVAASVGAGVAGSAVSSVGSSASGGSMAKATDVLNEGQKVFLTGQLALAGLPELCDALASGLDWTMLNIQLPWEMEESDDPRVLLLRTMFWSFLILVALSIVHLLMLGLLFHWRIRIPSILRIPRLELYFGYWAVPAITTGSAALFKRGEDDSDRRYNGGIHRIFTTAQLKLAHFCTAVFALLMRMPCFVHFSPENVGMGVIFLILFPGVFVLGHIWVMWYFFFRKSPEQYKAIMVLDDGGGDDDDEEEDTHGIEDISECCKGCGRCFCCFLERFVWTPILGPPYDGEWIVPKGPQSVFFSRFGSMFDEYRGAPMTIREGSYRLDRATSKVDRGTVTKAEPSSSIFVSRLEGTAMGYHLQICGKILDIFKLAFIATMISGEDDPDSIAQLIVLLVLSVVMLVMLRLFRMPIARWDLGMAMVGEASDIVTFSIALAIMTRDMSRHESRLAGTVMILTKLISFVASFLDTLLMVWEIVMTVFSAFKEKLFTPNPKLLDVIAALQKQNHGYLERKYFNRWVLKTLGKGIQVAPVKKGYAPFEELIYFKLFSTRREPTPGKIAVTERPPREYQHVPNGSRDAGDAMHTTVYCGPRSFDVEIPEK